LTHAKAAAPAGPARRQPAQLPGPPGHPPSARGARAAPGWWRGGRAV